MEVHNINILMGEEAVKKYEDGILLKELKDSVQSYSFQSEVESKAFLFGLKEGLGWQDFQVIEYTIG